MRAVLIWISLLVASPGSVFAQPEDEEETGESEGAEGAEETVTEKTGDAEGEDGGGEDLDAASDPPEVEPEPYDPDAPRPMVSGSLRSEMFFTRRARMRNLGGGAYGVRSMKVFPFYETIQLRADELGHPGLSVHFQGWAGVDLADVYFDQRVVADPTYLYVQFRDYGADIRLGRQQIYTGATRGLHIDGLYASYESPIHLGIEAHGGLVVSPYLGPEWYREQPASPGYGDFGAGFSDWEREGDYAVGGRVFYRMTGKISAGVSMLHVTELDEIDRQLLGVDLDVTPLSWLGASGNAALDLVAKRLQEANFAVDVYPHEMVSIAADYRHADPTLYLSKMSIFSVFSMEEYDSVGGAVRVDPLDWLALSAGYHHRFYSYIEERFDAGDSQGYGAETELGYDIEAGALLRYGARNDGLVRLDYHRLGQDELGAHSLRLGAIVPIALPGLRAAANAYLDLYDQEIENAELGFLGDVGLFYGNETIETGGSVAAGITPYAEHEVRGMLKLSYNFDVSFVERGYEQ